MGALLFSLAGMCQPNLWESTALLLLPIHFLGAALCVTYLFKQVSNIKDILGKNVSPLYSEWYEGLDSKVVVCSGLFFISATLLYA